MGEPFKGWRRKAGCVTLVMALVFVIVWIRSLYRWEQLYFPVGSQTHLFVSKNGGFGWSSWNYVKPEHGFTSMDAKLVDEPFRVFMKRWDAPYYASWNVKYWYGLYWQITLSLTLLSAILLLWPDKRRPMQVKAPIDLGPAVSNQIT